jgi:hypothetical protein
LLAALTQEFDETTVDNVEEGKQSIALVFDDQHKPMWRVGTNAFVLPGAADEQPRYYRGQPCCGEPWHGCFYA